ncbi:MAG: type IV pilus assembly protein PilM [Candidatus Spechtbacterales bacterium]
MPWNFFSKKKKRSLGVDVGTSSVKIVELAKDGDKIELTNYGEFSRDSESAFQSSSVRLSSAKAADIIKKIIQEAHIEGTSAAMSVPVFSGFSTVISLPKMSDEELAQAVTYEAKKYIPLPLSEVKFEWVRVSDTRVLIVAVTNELVNKYSEIAKLSGLALTHLELDTFSLARSLVGNTNTALVIDIGSRNTILAVVERGWPVFTRTSEVSGYELSKLLASSLGTDFSRAEDLKKKRGVDAGADVILPLLDSIFIEGRGIIEENLRTKNIDIKKVVLSGGSARMSGILEYAAKSIGREVSIGFPFNGIIYPDVLDSTVHEIGPSFSVAVGLALREFR